MSTSLQPIKRPRAIHLIVAGLVGFACISFAVAEIECMELELVPPPLHENLLLGTAVLHAYGDRLIGMERAELEKRFGEGKSGSCEDRFGQQFDTVTYRLGLFPTNPCKCVWIWLKDGKVHKFEITDFAFNTFY